MDGEDQYFTLEERIDVLEVELELREERISIIEKDIKFFCALLDAEECGDMILDDEAQIDVLRHMRDCGIEVDGSYFTKGFFSTDFESALEQAVEKGVDIGDF
jgi:3-dehydroquinate dehydratase